MKGKKLIALVLCLLLTISLLPVSALAEGDGEEPAQPVDTTPPTAETDPGEAPQGDAKDNETTPPADDGDDTTPPAGTGDGDVIPPADDGDDETNPPAEEDKQEVPALKGNRSVAYYLVGSRNEWNTSTGVQLSANDSNPGEYMVNNITLTQGEEFKIIGVDGGNVTWYPDGNDNNYVVDANHAGTTTVYFRPDGQGGDGWFNGTIFVPAQPTKYTVNVSDIDPTAGGTVTASPQRAAEGETVTLTVTENTGPGQGMTFRLL